MIFDHIQNAGHYSGLKDIFRALCFLREASGHPPEGRVEIDGDRIFANPVSLVSKPAEECVYEAHRKYIDVHFILSGIEGISIRQVDELAPEGEFSTEKDIGFYRGEPSGTCYLKPGEFMVCWPEDAHRVAMMQEHPAAIQKIVVKVAVE